MTARKKFLSRTLALAALTALAGTAVANASPSRAHPEKHLVGRVASVSATGFTINGKALTATSRQLAGLANGQCVEAKARLAQGVLQLVRVKREDRCAPLTAATAIPAATAPATAPVVSDDPANHDVGDDHGRLSGSDDPAQHDVADDDSAGRGGADDPANHDAGDDHGRHGSNHA
jgi:hypothetical protein